MMSAKHYFNIRFTVHVHVHVVAYRSSSVQYLQHTLLTVALHNLSVAIFNGWVILFHEDALHKLHCLKYKSTTMRCIKLLIGLVR